MNIISKTNTEHICLLVEYQWQVEQLPPEQPEQPDDEVELEGAE
jgi:hypothetical protein